MPTRELYWNITGHLFMYLFVLAFAVLFVWGLYRRYQMWRLGKADERFKDFWQWKSLWPRIKTAIVDVLIPVRLLRDAYPGIMHLAIFWGFVVLFIGTLFVAAQADLGINTLFGTFYLLLSLALDIFGLIAIAGVLMAIWRRYVTRPKRLDNTWDDTVVLWGLLAILLTGYLLQGLRIAAVGDEWAAWAPVGNAVASLFLALGWSAAGIEVTHRLLWWFHMFLGAGFVAYLPFSKLFHIFASHLNQFFRSFVAYGALPKVDIENSETFGVSKVEEFTWKQLFDTDACTRCGRCQDNCPANLSGKGLSPKALIQDLKTHLWEVGPGLIKSRAAAARAAKAAAGGGTAGGEAAATADAGTAAPAKAMVGEVIKDEDIWACTTCRACDEQCPVYVEHIDKIVDMRRYLSLMEMRFPPEVDRAFRNIQNQSNPWGIGAGYRADWANDLGVRKLSGGEAVDVLYWVGCAGAFDDRNKKVATSFVKILKAAGVNFGILGTDEKCCGDSARRLGNEYLFQMLAQENVEVMKQYGVKKIVTTCPHCYNTLKNEYPQFGGDFEVIHHSEFIAKLLADGKLSLNGQGRLSGLVTYHDSCYLGRYNSLYAQPREIVKGALADNGRFVEMRRNHAKSFCCGAGGGRMWLEESQGQRINELRVDQAAEVKAETVVTACPYCLTMFSDGIKNKSLEEKMRTIDLAEVVAARLKE
jgi:Fe-S oxidoreductase/nitrate reductase gamma subunit